MSGEESNNINERFEKIEKAKKKCRILKLVIIFCIVFSIGMSTLYYFGIKHFVPKELTFKEDVVISVNCDCKCADGCKCTENGPCKCADCFKCEKDEKYIIVTNPTAPNINAIVCISAAFIVLLICLTVIAVKLICYCKNADDKSHEEEKAKKMEEWYGAAFRNVRDYCHCCDCRRYCEKCKDCPDKEKCPCCKQGNAKSNTSDSSKDASNDNGSSED